MCARIACGRTAAKACSTSAVTGPAGCAWPDPQNPSAIRNTAPLYRMVSSRIQWIVVPGTPCSPGLHGKAVARKPIISLGGREMASIEKNRLAAPPAVLAGGSEAGLSQQSRRLWVPPQILRIEPHPLARRDRILERFQPQGVGQFEEPYVLPQVQVAAISPHLRQSGRAHGRSRGP